MRRFFETSRGTGFVRMISGFHRSPEVMGWQAAVMVIICIFLLSRRPRWLPLWVGLAVWGFSLSLIANSFQGRRQSVFRRASAAKKIYFLWSTKS